MFIISKLLIPEYSILMRWSPIVPIIIGKIKLIELGKKDVVLISKNELKKTSKTLNVNNAIPV